MLLLNLLLFVATLVVLPNIACANMPVIDVSNLAQNTITATKTADMLTQQLKQVKYEIDNLKTYINNPAWQTNMARELAELNNIVSQSVVLANAMQNLAAQFNKQYPGYQPAQDYPQQYQLWSTNTMTIFQETLKNIGVQLSNNQNEQISLEALHSFNNSPQGRLQALQTGNNLAAMTTQQTIQLRQLIANQARAENAYVAYQVQKDQSAEAAISTWVKASDTQWPGYRNQGFGPDNFPNI